MDRKQMTQELEAWMSSGFTQFKDARRLPAGKNPLKSYLVEANAPELEHGTAGLESFLRRASPSVAVTVEPTRDETLHILKVGRKAVAFYVDTLDTRFWLLHSTAKAERTDVAIRSLVNRTRFLDSVWFPTHLFRDWIGEVGVPRTMTSKFAVRTGLYQEDWSDQEYLDDSLALRVGSSADARGRWDEYASIEQLAQSLALWSAKVARRENDRELVAVDDITASGKVTSRGNSFRLHQELLYSLQRKYADTIQGWEGKYRIDWIRNGSKLRPTGETAEIPFIAEPTEGALIGLIETLFNCGEPFRLYGTPIRRGASNFAIKGVDLHTGDKVDFEITAQCIRLYLHQSACGNVLARLLTNLQHYYDARLILR